jgi:ferredoxin-type protein NapH
MRRQSIRKAIILISFLLFPVAMNFLSPYLIITGAAEGIITGCFIIFGLLFASSMVMGRAFCGWLCPMACLQEVSAGVNGKKAGGGRKDWIKYFIWAPWILGIIAAAVSAGGFHKIDPLYLTETGISVDSPMKYITYYGVLAIFVILSFVFGKRASCHYICWMAPFMVIGKKIRNAGKWPALHLEAESTKCNNCKMCEKKCPMSLEVNKMVQKGDMENSECILCGECADTCARNAIGYAFGYGKKSNIVKEQSKTI